MEVEDLLMGEECLIRLDQFLKVKGLVGSGGEAKVLIREGVVKLNGEVETRRRKQLFEGDRVEFNGEIFEVRDPLD